jgi:hypothetical protein
VVAPRYVASQGAWYFKGAFFTFPLDFHYVTEAAEANLASHQPFSTGFLAESRPAVPRWPKGDGVAAGENIPGLAQRRH